MSAKCKLVCQVCGTALSGGSEACPVCALRRALGSETTSLLDFSSELRFEHYQVLKNKDGTPVELGRGAMGITYKALDVHLQCPVALKIINADSSATTRLGVVLCEKHERRPVSGIPTWRRCFIWAKAAAITFTRWSLSMEKRWQNRSNVLADWSQMWRSK